MPSANALASRSSSANGSVTPITSFVLSFTPMTMEPPAVLAKATVVRTMR